MKKFMSALAAAVLTYGAMGLTGMAAEKVPALLFGDADCSGEVRMNDAVRIMQSVANPDEYSLTVRGASNADVHERGDGVSNMDALAVQKYLIKAGELPASYKAMEKAENEALIAGYVYNWINFYREADGKAPLTRLEGGDKYSIIRAEQTASDYVQDNDKMKAAVATAFDGKFYDSYDMFAEMRGRSFMTETDLDGEVTITDIDTETLAKNFSESLLDNPSAWNIIKDDIVAGIGVGTYISESDGRVYFNVFLAAKQPE
ncbi:MAG: hypothetical protein IKS13_05270 [Ruminococcus sp.]|nr:hypothetical protein [Ruminococcus sp.]